MAQLRHTGTEKMQRKENKSGIDKNNPKFYPSHYYILSFALVKPERLICLEALNPD